MATTAAPGAVGPQGTFVGRPVGSGGTPSRSGTTHVRAPEKHEFEEASRTSAIDRRRRGAHGPSPGSEGPQPTPRMSPSLPPAPALPGGPPSAEEECAETQEDPAGAAPQSKPGHASDAPGAPCWASSPPPRQQPPRSVGAAAAAAAAFARQSHGLVVPASHVAAMVGLHPHRDLPDLALQLVYQGAAGRELQRLDAQLLGLELASPEEHLVSLARKAGPDAAQALNDALLVRHQRTRVATADAADRLQRAVGDIAEKSQALTPSELAALREGSRHAVFTGFGTAHESVALDWYERRCGWEVRQRNAETRLWDFIAAESGDGGPTAAPLGPSYAKEPVRPSGSDDGREVMCDDHDSDAAPPVKSFRGSTRSAAEERAVVRPLFRIASKVDGIRDELVPNRKHRSPSSSSPSDGAEAADVNDDDSWVLRRVVVECKHRMRRLSPEVPLYEQVQAALYCLMFDTDAADLVQVLRQRRRRPTEQSPPHQGQQRRPKRPRSQSSTNSSDEPLQRDASSPRRKEVSLATPQPTIRDFFSRRSIAAPPPKAVSEAHVKVVTYEPHTVTDAGPSTAAAPEEDPVSRCSACSSALPATPAQDHADPTVLGADRKKEVSPPPVLNECQESVPSNDPDASNSNGACGPAEDESAIPVLGDRDDDHDVDLEMMVTRIDLDDPLLQHRRNWKEIVLPRLRAFVEALYAVRCDDSKRYRLLLHVSAAAAGDAESRREAWSLLHEECPWLAGCDTAYWRDP